MECGFIPEGETANENDVLAFAYFYVSMRDRFYTLEEFLPYLDGQDFLYAMPGHTMRSIDDLKVWMKNFSSRVVRQRRTVSSLQVECCGEHLWDVRLKGVWAAIFKDGERASNHFEEEWKVSTLPGRMFKVLAMVRKGG